MNRLRTALQNKRLSLFVSLYANDAKLARAALEEGADGLKVHMNVGHRASGNHFGPLAEYEMTFREIRSLYDGPLGIVPGGATEDIRQEEIDRLPGIGIDFYSIYAFHLPSFLLRSEQLARTFAVNDSFDLQLVRGAAPFGMDALEASIVPGNEYGSQLTFADLLKYRYLVETSGLPVIVPSQRKIVPEDIPALYDSGVQAVLVGAIVTGKTEDGIRKAVSELRNAVDRLGGN
ncbi:hypothetical protein [Paenibacillus thalictri]|uniref:N-acylglucosamine-6-phosphate 2-epimerase n=1 Tax=Paenibacillus thalictri TaxID=2527873 RepID=A0A4Q9DTT3_9BACL|nr:hypothetical protein [Paenibacillus thalictri]TBL79575.1 hypothetical protein EYB31_11805 [Paenibacillus thalictri]